MNEQVEEGTLLDDRWQRAAAAVADRDDQVCAAMIYGPDTPYPELPLCPSCGVAPAFFESPNALDYSATDVVVECAGCNYTTRPASFDTLCPEDAEHATPEAYAKHCKERADAIGLAAKRWELHCMGAEANLKLTRYRTTLQKDAEEAMAQINARSKHMQTTNLRGSRADSHDTPESLPASSEPEHAPVDLKQTINAMLWVVLPPSATLGEADAMSCEIYDKIMALWDREASR